MSGMMDPAFKNKHHERIKEARMELQGRLLLAFLDQEIVGQCPWDHPEVRRHFEQIEKIHGIRIENKEWMLREVEAIGTENKQETNQETERGSIVDKQDPSG
jgi:hypothetical protein